MKLYSFEMGKGSECSEEYLIDLAKNHADFCAKHYKWPKDYNLRMETAPVEYPTHTIYYFVVRSAEARNKRFSILRLIGTPLQYFEPVITILAFSFFCMVPILGGFVTFSLIKDSYYYNSITAAARLSDKESLGLDFIILLISLIPSSIAAALIYHYHMY